MQNVLHAHHTQEPVAYEFAGFAENQNWIAANFIFRS